MCICPSFCQTLLTIRSCPRFVARLSQQTDSLVSTGLWRRKMAIRDIKNSIVLSLTIQSMEHFHLTSYSCTLLCVIVTLGPSLANSEACAHLDTVLLALFLFNYVCISICRIETSMVSDRCGYDHSLFRLEVNILVFLLPLKSFLSPYLCFKTS